MIKSIGLDKLKIMETPYLVYDSDNVKKQYSELKNYIEPLMNSKK